MSDDRENPARYLLQPQLGHVILNVYCVRGVRLVLRDFLQQCRCTQDDEKSDFRNVRSILESQLSAVAYMPAITWDLWPLYGLTCAEARTCLGAEVPTVYLVPIGAHEYWAANYFARLVLDFYREDIDPRGNDYGYDLEEMILLDYPNAGEHLDLAEFGTCSAVYLRLHHCTGGCAHVFLLMEDPSEGWNRIVRKYAIPTQVLIDSHKGLGDWYDCVPLSGYMAETPEELLPEFYFKGKYISHHAPVGCEHLCDIPEIDHHTRMSQLYRMHWKQA